MSNLTLVLESGSSNSNSTEEVPTIISIFVLLPGMVDADTANAVAEAVYCYILPVLVILGTTGNVLSLIVLCVQKKKDTITTSLTALAIADTGYIVTTFIRQTSCIMGKYDPVLARNFTTLMYGQMVVVNIVFARISGLVTAVISTERSMAVLIPLKVRNIVTNQRMAIIYILVYLGSFVLIGPVFFMGESYWTTNPMTNRTYVTYAYTKWYMKNKLFADNYRDIFLNIMFRFFPTVVVCVNTGLIIYGVRRSRQWRKEKTSSEDETKRNRERKMNIMLLAICGIFLVCTIPGLVFQAFTYATDEFSVFGRYRNMYRMTSAISLLCQFLNSSVNFIAYILLNDRFLKTFLNMFGCARFTRQGAVTKTSGTLNTKLSQPDPSKHATDESIKG